jgi:hypothetical protein
VFNRVAWKSQVSDFRKLPCLKRNFGTTQPEYVKKKQHPAIYLAPVKKGW